MSKIIPKKPALVYNSIEHQSKTAANSLTIGEWNRVVNILKQQANLNTKYLEDLHRLLFYDWNSDDSGYIVGDIFAGKQDKLVAGDNITIDVNNVISASGGGADSTYIGVNAPTQSVYNTWIKPSVESQPTEVQTEDDDSEEVYTMAEGDIEAQTEDDDSEEVYTKAEGDIEAQTEDDDSEEVYTKAEGNIEAQTEDDDSEEVYTKAEGNIEVQTEDDNSEEVYTKAEGDTEVQTEDDNSKEVYTPPIGD